MIATVPRQKSLTPTSILCIVVYHARHPLRSLFPLKECARLCEVKNVSGLIKFLLVSGEAQAVPLEPLTRGPELQGECR
jgi:hypothetical protein